MRCDGNCTGGHLNRRDFLRVGALSGWGLLRSQYLEIEAMAANTKPTAQSCILLWLTGGPSRLTPGIPNLRVRSSRYPRKHPAFRFRSCFRKSPGRWTSCPSFALSPQKKTIMTLGTQYAATGHRHNPSMKFPSFPSIITKEVGRRNSLPPFVQVMEMPTGKEYDDYFKAQFLGAQYDPMLIPNPNRPDSKVTRLNNDITSFDVLI